MSAEIYVPAPAPARVEIRITSDGWMLAAIDCQGKLIEEVEVTATIALGLFMGGIPWKLRIKDRWVQAGPLPAPLRPDTG